MRVYSGQSKYHNKRVYDDGYCFGSLLEHRFYQQCKLRLYAGEISDLQVHTRYPLVIDGIKIGTYTDDVSFYEIAAGRRLVVDTKGYRTQEFIIKKALMKICHNIEVIEVTEV